MHTFVLRKIDQVKGKINFYKLEIDGICEFDQFCDELQRGGEGKVLYYLFALMDSIANLRHPPAKKKVRELKGRKKSDHVKDFEIKKDVNGVSKRVYYFKDENGNVIVFGSSKSDQEEDIARLRRIKKEYFNSKIS